MARCNTQANDKATTSNNWKTPGTLVSRGYNTPPLQEDLVPRSKDGTGEKLKRKRRGKTKLLLGQTSETTNLERLNKLKEKKTTMMNKVENTPLGKWSKEHY